MVPAAAGMNPGLSAASTGMAPVPAERTAPQPITALPVDKPVTASVPSSSSRPSNKPSSPGKWREPVKPDQANKPTAAAKPTAAGKPTDPGTRSNPRTPVEPGDPGHLGTLSDPRISNQPNEKNDFLSPVFSDKSRAIPGNRGDSVNTGTLGRSGAPGTGEPAATAGDQSPVRNRQSARELASNGLSTISHKPSSAPTK